MGFVGVYRALYDYSPQGEGELDLQDGDLLFVIEKGVEDDWWRAKKKANSDEEEEPEGLVPNNYVEEVGPSGQARALYDYSRQTDEELSFSEDATLNVYDTTDPDWTLVELDGEYGFVPANYIELGDISTSHGATASTARSHPAAPPSPAASPAPETAAANIANILSQRSVPSATQYTPEASDEEAPPPMPERPVMEPGEEPPPPPPIPGVPKNLSTTDRDAPSASESSNNGRQRSDSMGGFQTFNISEMISHMGKNKKMPTTLGISLQNGLIKISSEKSRDGSSNEWTAEKLTHYSIEGKHVFVELIRPSRSIDFHAGSKNTAQEIVSLFGDLAGAARAESIMTDGFQNGEKGGKMLYDFMAQGEDEVTVAAEDEVVVIDDTQSEEWWMVRRLKNGKEGVVPSSYVELTESTATFTPPVRKQSYVEQNRREEERATREAVEKAAKKDRRKSSKDEDSSKQSKPNPARVRMWTDRSASFSVEAEFLGIKDGKIHLHKVNGIKIAVQTSKMSVADLEYVESVTGVSLDDEKPLSDVKQRSSSKPSDKQLPREPSSASHGMSGAEVEEPKKPKYDWFDFFLQAGVNPQICERYASAFDRDNIGEESMEDIEPTLLRTLGFKEGDILRVMKLLDSRYGRTRDKKKEAISEEGLFSGPGGTLRNNTRKGRPAPAVENRDTVDPRAFEQDHLKSDGEPASTQQTASKPSSMSPNPASPVQNGNASFDDDAWNVKPTSARKGSASPAATSRSAPRPSPTPPAPPPKNDAPGGAAGDLSVLSPPLQPTLAVRSQTPPVSASASNEASQASQVADRRFFDQLGQAAPQSSIPNQAQQSNAARSRPQPPPQPQTSNNFLPPPPQRPASAPNNQQQSAFAPPLLQPQITGYQSQVAPPGESMNEITQRNYQQSLMQSMQPQQTGFNIGQLPQPTGYQQQFQPQQTGFYSQNPQQYGQQPSYMTAQPTTSPFADPPRLQYQRLQSQPTGINSFLPPALQPQPTGFSQMGVTSSGQTQQTSFGSAPQQFPQPTGFGGLHNQSQTPSFQTLPPVPAQPSGGALQPLRPQKTGPVPPVRFGVQQPAAKKLTPQPTGRANLANATPDNPFGF